MELRNSEYIRCKFETRAEKNGDESKKRLIVRGYPILFNTGTKVYDFWYGEIRETILPTALDNTDLSDVYLITGHDVRPEKVLGRTGINLRMETDETGLFIECELPNTAHARDIYNLIEQGLVDGMSFGFTCGDKVNEETLTRTITNIDELYEVTITPFPAYKQASIIAQKKRAKELEEARILEEKRAREEKIRKLEESLDD